MPNKSGSSRRKTSGTTKKRRKSTQSPRPEFFDGLTLQDRKLIAVMMGNTPAALKSTKPAGQTTARQFETAIITGSLDESEIKAFLTELPVSNQTFMEHAEAIFRNLPRLKPAQTILTALLDGKKLTKASIADYLFSHPSPTTFHSKVRGHEQTKHYKDQTHRRVGRLIYGDRHIAYERFLVLRDRANELRNAVLMDARKQSARYQKTSKLTEMPLDGFEDIGAASEFSPEGKVLSSGREREVVIVDRVQDQALRRMLKFAASLEPFKDRRKVEELQSLISREFRPEQSEMVVGLQASKPDVFLGGIIDPAFPALCRHRALLFHTLAQHAGVTSTLFAGKQEIHKEPTGENDHAWCEVKIGSRTYHVDLVGTPTHGIYPLTRCS